MPFLDQFGSLFDVINYLEWLRGLGDECFKQRRSVIPSSMWIPIYLAALYGMVGDFEKGLRELGALEREEVGQYFQEYIERLRKYLLSNLGWIGREAHD